MSLVTPDEVLAFWIGPTAHDASQLDKGMKLWFGKSEEVDREIAARFADTIEALAVGLMDEWAARGARSRLAAVITLDQFPRNIHRGSARAFSYDRMALGLVKDGLMFVVGDHDPDAHTTTLGLLGDEEKRKTK